MKKKYITYSVLNNFTGKVLSVILVLPVIIIIDSRICAISIDGAFMFTQDFSCCTLTKSKKPNNSYMLHTLTLTTKKLIILMFSKDVPTFPISQKIKSNTKFRNTIILRLTKSWDWKMS